MEETGAKPIEALTNWEIRKRIKALEEFEAHVSDLAYLELTHLRKELEDRTGTHQ